MSRWQTHWWQRRARRAEQTAAVLVALRDGTDTENYGLGLMDRSGVRAGSLYPVLARLEIDELITAHWETYETMGGRDRRRRLYRLTQAGRDRL